MVICTRMSGGSRLILGLILQVILTWLMLLDHRLREKARHLLHRQRFSTSAPFDIWGQINFCYGSLPGAL